MLNEELTDPSSAQSYHVPCEPALMEFDCWIPTKLVVVNLVKLHLTKFSAAASHLTSYNM